MGDRFSHLGLDDRERREAAHFSDLARIVYERGIPRFSSFLDERERVIAETAADGVACRAYGGHENAERTVCGYAPDAGDLFDAAYPTDAVTLRWRRQDSLSHRDILGALMALQIKRETLGDILVGEGVAVIFALPTACEVITRELTRAGNVGVSVLHERPDTLPQVRTEALEGVAASLRLDCIVAMMTKGSRSDAAALIRAGKITCGGQIITQGAFTVAEGMRISIRGTGKFVFRSVGAQTRSGRYHIQYEKYI